MDSYNKFSLQIPRYLIAVSAEWISADDVTLFKQLATSLYTTVDRCKQCPVVPRPGTEAGSSTSSTTCGNGSLRLLNQNVWVNVVVPNYQETPSSGNKLSVFNSGWEKVPEQERDIDQGTGLKDDGDPMLFSVMRQKFGRGRDEVDDLPVEKMREYTGMVASELDKIADELPTGGFQLDVVWLMPTSTEFPILERADAFLFSVLRRLEAWHKARVTIVLGKGVEGEDHPSLSHWKTFIESRVVSLRSTGSDGKDIQPEDILSSSSSLAWQGQVKYISSRGTAFPPWPGFSLHRLDEDSHRSEPFIEILNPRGDSGQEAAGSQQSMDDSFVSSLDDLKPKYVVNDTLEFIHLANLHEIPTWFILPGKFELRLKDKEKQHRYSRSRFWMRYLTHRLPGDGQGAICQLSCLELDGPIPTAQSQGLSTEIWTSGITSNPLNPTVPNVQLKGTKHTFFFLVHGDRRGRCIALPLVSPFMLNGAAHALLARHEAEEDTTDEIAESQPAREVIDSLPTLSGHQLKEDEEDLARMQVKALAMVIEKIKSEGLDINVTPSLLIFLFNYMRRVYYEGYNINDALSPALSPARSTPGAVESRGPSSSNAEETGAGGRADGTGRQRVEDVNQQVGQVERESRTTDISLDNIPTELDQSPSQWVERQALQNRESIANRLRRLRSEDMMLGGISVPPPDNNTITLSAKEFRSHFKPNGQPKRDDLALGQPAVVRQSPRTRSAAAGHHNGGLSVDELMKTEFKVALKLDYHGINYCQETPDIDSQSVDRRMVRLQMRCVRREMACTFTSHHQPTLAIRTKRKPSSSPCPHKAKIRKISTSVKKKPSSSTRQMTPRKKTMPTRTTTPRKGAGSTAETISTPKSQRNRPRKSTSGGLTPKRLRCSTPSKSRPEEMVSPRRSIRKLAKELPSSTFVSPSSTSRLPSTSVASSSSSQYVKKTSEKNADDAKSRRSSSTSESRSEKHKRKLRSIVEETLKTKGIDSSHACFKQCVTRLYTQTKMFVKDLKTSKGLYDEMRRTAEANADFVVSFELKRVTPKT